MLWLIIGNIWGLVLGGAWLVTAVSRPTINGRLGMLTLSLTATGLGAVCLILLLEGMKWQTR